MDPILSLSLAVQSNPGVYALLLGSGLSRAAQIPTGWEVTLDLIRKIAAMDQQESLPDLAAWYEERYGSAPSYSKLLEQLARTPAERQRILRGYFEPTAEDREEGLKVPTAAHVAIAELAAKGYIRVVVTTNFDRLLEQALEAQGVIPTRISTPDEAEGAPPLVHSGVTVIKLHGDYLDARIKNTPDELSEYEDSFRTLLSRVLDEFGLVISGWSGKWDIALCQALQRCQSRRYTTYWTDLRPPDDEIQPLIAHRRAQFIEVTGADSFFATVRENVFALEELARPHPLSIAAAVQTTKRYLAEERYDIRLHDLLTDQANNLRDRISDERFPRSGAYNSTELLRRVSQYEALSEQMIRMMSLCSYWGQERHRITLVRVMEALANPSSNWKGVTVWLDLRRYPALLVSYAAGISSLAHERYGNLAVLLLEPKIRKVGDDDAPLVIGLEKWRVLGHDVARQLPEMDRKHNPLSLRLEDVLRPHLFPLIGDDQRYVELFDRYEYFLALAYADVDFQSGSPGGWAPLGSFVWRRRYNDDVITKFGTEAEAAGSEWKPLKAGFFGGDFDRYRTTKQRVDEFVSTVAARYY